MTKQDAIKLFGNQSKLARALGISPSAVSQWGAVLTDAQADRVAGAAVRVGKLSVCPSGEGASQDQAAA